MTLTVPSLKETRNRIINDIIQNYNIDPDTSLHIDPSLRNNPEGAFAYALAQEADGLYKLIQFVVEQLFLDTATGEYLERLASFKDITRLPATESSGFVTFTGTATTNIPLGTVLTRTNGTLYETLASVTIVALSFSVSSLTRSGTTATATTTSSHGLSAGMDVTIAGANETDYNGTFTVTSVASATQFSYTVSGSPATPATGTITAGYDGIFAEVQSQSTGEDTNAVGGTVLTLSTPIAGIDSEAYVQFSELTEAVDEEDDDSLRSRALFKFQNPNTPFNTSAIESKAKEISGVTRVWVEEITPAEGQVTIYFVRDNDTSIIPDASEIAEVKTNILTIKPAHTADADVIVSAPSGVTINITFSSLTPNTSEMQTAITENLQDFFTSENEVGQDILLTQINSVIYNTVDSTGSQPQFTLSAPATDTTINAGEIGILGTITYP